MEQAKQNIMALINELDAAQDEESKASALSRLSIATFKALLLLDFGNTAADELAVFQEMCARYQGKLTQEAITSLNKYGEEYRVMAFKVVECLNH